MKAFVTYLEKESPAMQRPSGSTGWIELPNGQRWNPGHAYKFNAHESVRMKGGVILRFLPTKVRCLVGCTGGALWRLARNNKSADWNI